jgi:ferredoxin-fold anticodon binding domain-containing protein
MRYEMRDISHLSTRELKAMRKWHIEHRYADGGLVYKRFIDELDAEIFARRAKTIFWIMVVVCCVSAFVFIGAVLGVLEKPH